MDDDKIMKVSFPVGTGGAEVIVSRPTPAQAFVLALSRKPGDGADAAQDVQRLVRRIVRVMEQLMGRDAWDSVIEEGLITGTLAPDDLNQLVVDVLRFDWTLGVTDEVKERIVEEAKDPGYLPPSLRPAPRVVSGG